MVDASHEESRQYLENFWTPAAGSHVRFRKTLPVHKIQYIEPTAPEQAHLEGRIEIAYVQDLEWVPSPDEITTLLKRFGIMVLDENVHFGTSVLPRPKSYTEVAEVIRTYRQIMLMRGESDPYQAVVVNEQSD